MAKVYISSIFWGTVKILCVCCFLSFFISIIKSPFISRPDSNEQPLLDKNVHLCWGEISDYLVCGNHLILLYDDKNEIQYYNLDGVPLWSYIFNFGNNGRSHLHSDGRNLIVEDRSDNYYLFNEKGEFIEYITDPQRKETYKNRFLLKETLRISGSGATYALRGASIYKISSCTKEKVVSRPFWMAIFQDGKVLVLGIILLALVIAHHFYTKEHR